MQGLIDRQQWNNFLKDFNKRNALRASRLEILGDEIGAQEEEQHLPLSGVKSGKTGDRSSRVEDSLAEKRRKTSDNNSIRSATFVAS